MSQIADKRRKTDLDLFVLALVDCGVSTPYELQKAAGLSQGSTIPVLQRLLEAGFLLQGKPGLRGRTKYRVSQRGKQWLKYGWPPLVEAGPSGDVDADLRVALLALSAGGDRHQAGNFLRRAAQIKMELAGNSDAVKDINGVPSLAWWYSQLRSLAAKTRLAAESSAILTMANALPQSVTGKPSRSRLAAKNTRPLKPVSKGS